MNLFIDCEFNEFQGELISMALVSEDGREWYEVCGCDNPGPWVTQHVMPILGKEPIGLSMMRMSLANWLKQFQRVHIVADWPEDIAHFCNLLIVGPGTRIDTPHVTFEIFRVDAESEVPHNALADAQGLKKKLLG